IVRGQSHRLEAADSGFVRNEDQVSSSGDDGYDNADVMMAMSVEELLDWIIDSGSSYYITYMRDYLVDFKESMTVVIYCLVMTGNTMYGGHVRFKYR
ncbi:hypothetical protein Tco_0460692, partial [Tanacetum coccineum]